MKVIFETNRLVLRQFTETDAALLLSLNSDPEVLKYLHEPLLENKEHALEIIQTIILPQYEKNLGRWAVHTKENNEFIGWCGLKFRAELNETDLGYRFKNLPGEKVMQQKLPAIHWIMALKNLILKKLLQ